MLSLEVVEFHACYIRGDAMRFKRIDKTGMSAMAIDEQRFRFNAADGKEIQGYRWCASAMPKAALVVAHGAAEHAGRYKAPLTPMIEAGYAIYAEDHRGHGLTETNAADLGKLDAATVISDLAVLMRRARDENPNAPIIFMGHSLGSMLGQGFVLDHHGLIDGFVLSGTLDMITAFSNPRPPSAPFGDKMRENFAWLTSEIAEVDKYIADPLCGFALAPETLASFAPIAARAGDLNKVKKLPPNLPIFLFVGDKDPINRDLEFFTPLVERYKAAGLRSVTARVYKDGRHEMLNETNRAEVVRELQAWCDGVRRR